MGLGIDALDDLGVAESDAHQRRLGRALVHGLGQTIQKQHTREPTGVFFERVARTAPEDPASPKIGLGRFHAEIWVISWLGIDFRHFSKAQLVAMRFVFDGLRLHRLEAACVPSNEASKAVLRRCGFFEEGATREYLCINGVWRDHILFATLSSDRVRGNSRGRVP